MVLISFSKLEILDFIFQRKWLKLSLENFIIITIIRFGLTDVYATSLDVLYGLPFPNRWFKKKFFFRSINKDLFIYFFFYLRMVITLSLREGTRLYAFYGYEIRVRQTYVTTNIVHVRAFLNITKFIRKIHPILYVYLGTSDHNGRLSSLHLLQRRNRVIFRSIR